MAAWKERYLAVRGVGKDDEAKMKEVLTDYGGSKILSDYKRLTPTQVLELARKYGANYIITPTDYSAPFLEKLFKAEDPTRKADYRHPYYVFRIKV